MKQYLVIAVLLPALFGCATQEASNVPVPLASPHDKNPKAFCYTNNTAYPEGAVWNGKSCRREKGAFMVRSSSDLQWR